METEQIVVPDSRQYQVQHARYLSFRLLPFSRQDKRLLIFAGALWLYALLAGEKLYLVVIPIVTLVAIWKVLKGRTYRVFLDFWKGQKRTLLNHGLRWQSEKPQSEHDPTQTDLVASIQASPKSLQSTGRIRKRSGKESPPRKRSIPLEITPIGEIALIYNDIGKTDSLVFTGDGSPFEGMPLDGQYDFVQRIARISRDVTMLYPAYSLSCAWGLMKRPLDRFKAADDLASAHHPEALTLALAERSGRLEEAVANLPPYIDKSHFIRLLVGGRNMLQQLDLSEESDSVVTMFTTWTIRRDKLLSGSTDSLAEDQVNQLPISELAKTVSGELESIGIDNVNVLDLAGARRFVNSALNVTRVGDYYRWAHMYPEAAGETSKETEERLSVYFGNDAQALSTQLQAEHSPHWPQTQIREFKNYVEIDGTYLTTLVLTEHPEYTFPNFRSLLNLEFDSALQGEGLRWYSITDIGETVSSKSQVSRMNVAIPVMEHLTDSFSDLPQVRDSREQQRERRESYYREGYTTDSATLVTVLGSSKPQMELYARTAEAICRRMGLSPIRLTGASRQLNAALCQLGIPLL